MGWDRVPIGNVLMRSGETVSIRPDRRYRELTVRLWGKGVVLRKEVSGADMSASKRFVVRTNQFILSRIDSRNGAVGIVPKGLDGAVVSNDFPAFNINQHQILPEFLHWLSKTRKFVKLCRSASEGTTNRVRLQEDKFLALEIPLPPLDQQHRIVVRIEKLAANIEEARSLREESIGLAEAIVKAEELKIWPFKSLEKAQILSQVTTYLARGRQSKQGVSNHYLIKTRHVQMGRYVETEMTLSPHAANKVKPEGLVRPSDVLIACSAAGCLGRVAFYTDKAKKASTDTHVAIARANPEKVLPEYLYAYLRGAQGQHQLRSREKGDWQREKIGFRLTELNVADMKRVPVPVPPIDEQQLIILRLSNLLAKVDTLKRLQAETAAEFEALLPSILDKAFRGEL